MVTVTKQYNSFLGGLVGEGCQYRTDMERFGKWFSTADNVRFNDLGSFGNRPGFAKVAATKNNNSDEDIRLLSFSFNDENSYLIEMSSDVLRFFKDGRIVTVDGRPYELKNELILTPGQDIKYAQAADVIYICDGKQVIKELRRVKDDEFGFEWEFADFKFKYDAMPLDFENQDENKTISVTNSSNTNIGTFSKYDVFLKYRDGFPFFRFLSLDAKFAGSDSIVNIVTAKRNFYSLQEVASYIEKNNLYGISVSSSSESKKLSIQTAGKEFSYVKLVLEGVSNEPTNTKTFTNNIFFGDYATEFPIRYYYNDAISSKYNKSFELVNVAALGNLDKDRNDWVAAYGSFSNATTHTLTGDEWRAELRISSYQSNFHRFYKNSTTTYTDINTEYAPIRTWTFAKSGSVDYDKIATSNFDFWKDKTVGDVFGVRHRVSGQSVVHATGTNESVLKDTDGSWGLVTAGQWAGTVTLYYSTDGGTNWYEFYRVASANDDSPQNVNVTGEVESDGPKGVDLKLVTTLNDWDGDATPSFTLKTDAYETISYYQIREFVEKGQSEAFVSKAYVKGIKNDIGEIKVSPNWREGVFSESKGWPKAIGFYQNRLFFSKDWTLYGSKVNDFNDFYEPIELADDDPVTMSLLAYKVNTIENIVLLKGFFVFTGGGEFNIVSEGALTQKDKNLQQFSSHGSIQALPVIVGNHIMFVDKSANTIRAMKYVLDSDTYEAENVSILLEDNIKGKVIKTIEYLSETHEVLFLTEDGIIFVFKFLPEQNIACWSKWTHANGTITNICVVPNGHKEDLYIAVATKEGKQIERLSENIYKDSHEFFLNGPMDSVTTKYQEGVAIHATKVLAKEGTIEQECYENSLVGEDGVVDLGGTYDKVILGFIYKTEATLLSPEIIVDKMGNNTVYNRKRPFKVHFAYRNSYGVKVGVKDNEKMEVDWQGIYSGIEKEKALSSGKKSVLVPCRYDENANTTFLQEEPFRFEIINTAVEVDYGGK